MPYVRSGAERRKEDRRREDRELDEVIARVDAEFRRKADERADRRGAERRASGDRRSAS